jgi:hypothetical protein
MSRKIAPIEAHKTELTPGEKLRAAHAVIVNGVDQSIVAQIFNINIGRVNEAVQAIRQAIGLKPELDDLLE